MTNPRVHAADRQAVQLPGMFQRYRADINDALRHSLSQDGPAVYDMLRYYMGWVDVDGKPWVAMEGKALRPTLCLFACEAVGGSAKAAMPAAVALELIHNFSLIHDDVQDHDETRHNRPTLWAVWGIPKALVAGNVLRVVADLGLDDLYDDGVEAERSLAVTGLLAEAYLEMIEGQYMDISYEGRPDIGLDEYLQMISRKTGALIRCALNLGAVVGSPDRATAEAFRACGRSLGYVFQIRDDILGVWGDEETTGKPVGADVRRKKNSFPVVYAMSQAEPEDEKLLKEAYAKEQLSNDDVATVLEVMERSQVREKAHNLAATHCDQALEAMAEIELTPEVRRDLEDLLHFLTFREH